MRNLIVKQPELYEPEKHATTYSDYTKVFLLQSLKNGEDYNAKK